MPKGLTPSVRRERMIDSLDARADREGTSLELRGKDVGKAKDLRKKATDLYFARRKEIARVGEGREARGLDPEGTLPKLPRTKLPKAVRPTNLAPNMGTKGGPGTGPSKARKNVAVVKELARRAMGGKAVAAEKSGFSEAIRNPELRQSRQNIEDRTPHDKPAPRPKAKKPKPRAK